MMYHSQLTVKKIFTMHQMYKAIKFEEEQKYRNLVHDIIK